MKSSGSDWGLEGFCPSNAPFRGLYKVTGWRLFQVYRLSECIHHNQDRIITTRMCLILPLSSSTYPAPIIHNPWDTILLSLFCLPECSIYVIIQCGAFKTGFIHSA